MEQRKIPIYNLNGEAKPLKENLPPKSQPEAEIPKKKYDWQRFTSSDNKEALFRLLRTVILVSTIAFIIIGGIISRKASSPKLSKGTAISKSRKVKTRGKGKPKKISLKELLTFLKFRDEGKFVYERKGRRDPFSPLVLKKGKIARFGEPPEREEIEDLEEPKPSIGEMLTLKGILWSAYKPLALVKINERGLRPILIRRGDLIDVEGEKVRVIDIKKDGVILFQGERFILRLKKDEEDRGF